MPIVKVLRAECDGCGGTIEWRGKTAMLLRRHQGWVFEGRKCYCPSCVVKPKYEKGQRVDMDGGIAGVAVPVTLTVAVRRWFQPDGWTYDLADNESRVIHWYDIPESDLRPHTMTVADLTPAQRRIQPGRKVRVKAIQNREDGGVIEGADRDEPNKEVTVLSMRPFQGAFVCIIHADTWCWPWNLELVEEGGA